MVGGLLGRKRIYFKPSTKKVRSSLSHDFLGDTFSSEVIKVSTDGRRATSNNAPVNLASQQVDFDFDEPMFQGNEGLTMDDEYLPHVAEDTSADRLPRKTFVVYVRVFRFIIINMLTLVYRKGL
jgi:hypothetical protein